MLFWSFFPIIVTSAACGFVGGAIITTSKIAFKAPPFQEEETGKPLGYFAIARRALTYPILMAMLFALLPYPLYSSGGVPKEQITSILFMCSLISAAVESGEIIIYRFSQKAQAAAANDNSFSDND